MTEPRKPPEVPAEAPRKPPELPAEAPYWKIRVKFQGKVHMTAECYDLVALTLVVEAFEGISGDRSALEIWTTSERQRRYSDGWTLLKARNIKGLPDRR